VPVSGITNAIALSAGYANACAILATGGLDCWGDNRVGDVGDGTTTERNTPVAVSGITNATAVSAGDEQSCALLATGGVDCWGWNSAGELGDGTTSGPETCTGYACSSTPVAVSGITNATAVSAGDGQSCALLATGGVDCWGSNADGALGDGTTIDSDVPVAVSGITTATAVTAGEYVSCARLAFGGVDCWGVGGAGELGDGMTADSDVPLDNGDGITNARTNLRRRSARIANAPRNSRLGPGLLRLRCFPHRSRLEGLRGARSGFVCAALGVSGASCGIRCGGEGGDRLCAGRADIEWHA
jgi:alpha-tubulin suppressor-like RCC1 family protein